MDLALNNLQWLMCHKTKTNQTKTAHVINVFNNLGSMLDITKK